MPTAISLIKVACDPLMDFSIGGINFTASIGIQQAASRIDVLIEFKPLRAEDQIRKFTLPDIFSTVSARRSLLIGMRAFVKEMYSYLADKYPDEQMIPPKEYRRISTYRSIMLTRIMHCLAIKKVCEKLEVPRETFSEINRVAFRLYPIRKNSSNTIPVTKLFVIRQHDPEYFDTIMLNDFKKYRPAMCRYIISKLSDIYLEHDRSKRYTSYYVTAEKETSLVLRDEYMKAIESCPPVVKFNKYNVNLSPFYDEGLKSCQTLYEHARPHDRMGWYLFSVLGGNGLLNVSKSNGKYAECCKLIQAGNKLWYVFKKRHPNTKNFGMRHAKMIFDTIVDGKNIYKNTKNYFGDDYPVVEVKGSAVRMLRAALYNHDIEQKINKDKILMKPCWDLPEPVVSLPQWVEDIRMKTNHELLIAGKECEHCIGSYEARVIPGDLFLRQETICAYVSLPGKSVVQIYDHKNTITPASEKLRQKLTRWLKDVVVDQDNLRQKKQSWNKQRRTKFLRTEVHQVGEAYFDENDGYPEW